MYAYFIDLQKGFDITPQEIFKEPTIKQPENLSQPI